MIQNAVDRGDTFFGMDVFTFSIWVQVIGWISQFVGHGFFEGRAPAITTNVFFLFLANFFVIFETLHFGFGYRTGKQMDQIRKQVEKDVDKFNKTRFKSASPSKKRSQSPRSSSKSPQKSSRSSPTKTSRSPKKADHPPAQKSKAE